MPQGSQHQTQKRRMSQALKVLKRLEKHALSGDGDTMTTSQIRAAEIVLRKAIPDLRATEHTMDKETMKAFCLVRNGSGT